MDGTPSGFRTREAPTAEDDVTSAFIEFETIAGRGVGHLRLKGDEAWTLLTALQELKGFEEAKGATRVRGARLRQLGVPTIVVDRHDRPGDQWRKRYQSLRLHDPVWYDHLPYLPFPPNWPVFAPKDKIADWLEFYTRVMEVPYWPKTTCLSASYDEAAHRWTVDVERDGERLTLYPTLGSNNSAHDICKALYENGVDVTMALPYRIMHEFQIPLYDQMRERDKKFYDRLADAGFELDWGADGSGLFMKYLRRGSGYYIDVGACDLVADGTELPADVVVYATGYGSMNGWAADLIGQDVADKVGKVWGLGSDTPKDRGPWEGEQRNMWKPTQQENLWFHGGNLHQSRHYSLHLALQLKARYVGLATPVYGLQEVHHVS